jgi:hypothetical protein
MMASNGWTREVEKIRAIELDTPNLEAKLRGA